MRWTRWLLCVGVGGMIGVSVFGQTEFDAADEDASPAVEALGVDAFGEEEFVPSDALPLEESRPVAESASAEEASFDAPVAEEVVEEEQALRKQYLQLIEQKSGLMDRSALREAISRAEKDIDELKADERLQEARQLLLELVKAHPRTTAARSARMMLQAVPAQDYEGIPQTAPYEAPPTPTPIESAPFDDNTRAPRRDTVPTPAPTPTY